MTDYNKHQGIIPLQENSFFPANRTQSTNIKGIHRTFDFVFSIDARPARGRHRPPPRPPRDPRETLKRPSSSGMWRCGRPRRRGWPPAARSAVYSVRRFQPSCWYSTARLEIPGPSTLQMRRGGVPQSIHARSNPCASAYMCSHGSARVRPAPRLRSLVLRGIFLLPFATQAKRGMGALFEW